MIALVIIAVVVVGAAYFTGVFNKPEVTDNSDAINDAIEDSFPTQEANPIATEPEQLPAEAPLPDEINEETSSAETSEETTLPESTETETSETEPSEEEPSSVSSFVDDGTRDGINHLYFAKEFYKKTGSEIASEAGGEYTFGRAKTYPGNETRYTKEGDAQYILENTESGLSVKKEFTTKEDILEKLTDTIAENTTITFRTYKMQPAYEKIDVAPLGSELFVFAKTANLDEKEITINIKEKEPLLLDEADANLNVVLVEGEGDNATEGEEVTDLKATIEDGYAAIKIRLKPKDEENEEGSTPNLDEWRSRISGEVEEGTHTYTIQKEGGITVGENEASSIATTIETNSNNELSPYYVKAEDIQEILENTEGSITSVPGIPKYIKKDREAENYTYTFTNENGTVIGHPGTDNTERRNYIASIIESNINEGKKLNQPEDGDNPRLQNGVSIKAEDISKALTEPNYSRGDTISFPTYKKIKPLLWLKGSCNGDEHEDLNQSGENEGTYFEIGKSNYIIFPLLVKPENDTGKKWDNYYWAAAQGANQATFNSNRSRGTRKHAGRDLYTNPKETIVAIAPGKVLSISAFYAQTDQITIHHKTGDNREFIIRYGELDPGTIEVSVGDTVTQGQTLGVTGKLVGITVISGETVYMIHFEHFTGDEGFSVSGNNSLSNGSTPFKRRSDLVDSIDILEEGYRNTFNETQDDRVDPNTLSASEDVIQFIKDYEVFRANAYDDAEGYCTIGYGHLIAYDNCSNIDLPEEFENGITEARAVELFEERLPEFENGVRRDITVNLYQHEFDALVSLLFNAGENFLNVGGVNDGETQIKIKINNGDYAGGADEFADVTNGGLAGLVTRRNAEINMFKNNIYDSTH